GFDEKSEFDLEIVPYSETTRVTGFTDILLVLLDATTRSVANTWTVGPVDNNEVFPVILSGGQDAARDVTKRILLSLTGDMWNVLPEVDALHAPSEDEWYSAMKLLEKYVCVEDVVDTAVGVVSATSRRVLAPSMYIPHAADGQRGTRQGSWLMRANALTLGPDDVVTWYGEGDKSERVTNQEARYWTPMGIPGVHYMVTWNNKDGVIREEDYGKFPLGATVSEASAIARLWRAVEFVDGVNLPFEMTTQRSFELFVAANALMQAAVVTLIQMCLGIPMYTWGNYTSLNKRWCQWIKGFMALSTFDTITVPPPSRPMDRVKLFGSWIDYYSWDDDARRITVTDAHTLEDLLPVALLPAWLARWWMEKFEGLWAPGTTPAGRNIVVEDTVAGGHLEFMIEWDEYSQWMNVAEWTVELPMEKPPGRKPTWWSSAVYSTNARRKYPQECPKVYDRYAYDLSIVPHRLQFPHRVLPVSITAQMRHAPFEFIERGNYIIPFVRQAEFGEKQSIATNQLYKHSGDPKWTGELESRLPDPWYDWLVDAAATMLPFLATGNPWTGLVSGAAAGLHSFLQDRVL
ncbi:unnamed protein product, partial [Cylicostephanus goldi]